MQKAVFKGLMLALLIGLAPSVRADDDEPAGASWFPQLTGTIVSVRADVLQVRPRFSSQLTRVLINADTKLQTMQFLPIKDLTEGMRIMAMGDKIAGKPLIANMIMAPTANDGFFGGETKGIQAGGYGNSVMWGGKIKTLQPLTVTDDAGADLPVLTAPNTPVMKTVQGPANNLRVSQAIRSGSDSVSYRPREPKTSLLELPSTGLRTIWWIDRQQHFPVPI